MQVCSADLFQQQQLCVRLLPKVLGLGRRGRDQFQEHRSLPDHQPDGQFSQLGLNPAENFAPVIFGL